MTPPLRVLVVSTSRHVWGAERSVIALSGPLARQGVELVLASPPGTLADTWRDTGHAHVALEIPERRGLRASDRQTRAMPLQLARELQRSTGATRAVGRVARAAEAHVIHSNSLWGHLDCAVGGRLARLPVVLELHDIVRPGLGQRVLASAVRLAAGTVAISQAVARCAGTANASRVQVVPQAVDLAHFHPGPADARWRQLLASDPHAPIVGILGRVDPEKRVDLLVQAMGRLSGPAARAQLAVVGAPGTDGGKYLAQLRRDARAVLGERVRFVAPTHDVPAALRAMDLLVNASDAEPFGLSVLEAQACGVPVVATDGGGIPDFVVDGDTGVLVPADDADALADAVRRLVEDPAIRSRLSIAARRHAEQAHGIDQRARSFARVYRDAVAKSATGGPKPERAPKVAT